MNTVNNQEPGRCIICGHYLTTVKAYAGYRCLDPAHWQAAGLLTSNDFYPMARLVAQAHGELNGKGGDKIGSD